jgi:predicted regulator of amino acid metabolism with ACT domain
MTSINTINSSLPTSAEIVDSTTGEIRTCTHEWALGPSADGSRFYCNKCQAQAMVAPLPIKAEVAPAPAAPTTLLDSVLEGLRPALLSAASAGISTMVAEAFLVEGHLDSTLQARLLDSTGAALAAKLDETELLVAVAGHININEEDVAREIADGMSIGASAVAEACNVDEREVLETIVSNIGINRDSVVEAMASNFEEISAEQVAEKLAEDMDADVVAEKLAKGMDEDDLAEAVAGYLDFDTNSVAKRIADNMDSTDLADEVAEHLDISSSDVAGSLANAFTGSEKRDMLREAGMHFAQNISPEDLKALMAAAADAVRAQVLAELRPMVETMVRDALGLKK